MDSDPLPANGTARPRLLVAESGLPAPPPTTILRPPSRPPLCPKTRTPLRPRRPAPRRSELGRGLAPRDDEPDPIPQAPSTRSARPRLRPRLRPRPQRRVRQPLDSATRPPLAPRRSPRFDFASPIPSPALRSPAIPGVPFLDHASRPRAAFPNHPRESTPGADRRSPVPNPAGDPNPNPNPNPVPPAPAARRRPVPNGSFVVKIGRPNSFSGLGFDRDTSATNNNDNNGWDRRSVGGPSLESKRDAAGDSESPIRATSGGVRVGARAGFPPRPRRGAGTPAFFRPIPIGLGVTFVVARGCPCGLPRGCGCGCGCRSSSSKFIRGAGPSSARLPRFAKTRFESSSEPARASVTRDPATSDRNRFRTSFQ